MFLLLLLKGTHAKFNDVIDEVSRDGLPVHFVDNHLLQNKKVKIRNEDILPINHAYKHQHDVTM